MTKTKKIIIALCVIIPIIACCAFTAVSHLVFDRSVMASLNEIYLGAANKDVIFETEEDFAEKITNEKNKQLSGENYEIPEKLKLSVSAEYKTKHGMQVYYLNKASLNKSDTVIFYLHGGSFINEITKEHWKLIDFLAEKTGHPFIVPLYPRLPLYSCEDACQALMALYKDTAKKDNIKHIYFVGDSSGGTLALSLAKQLREEKINQPEKLVLISPWLDLTMKNKDIASLESKDSLLGFYGLKTLGKMWADKRAVTNPTVSPIFSRDEKLGEITIFASEKEILYPDILKYSESLKRQKIEHQLITEKGLSHCYVLYNTPEAKQAKAKIAEIIL